MTQRDRKQLTAIVIEAYNSKQRIDNDGTSIASSIQNLKDDDLREIFTLHLKNTTPGNIQKIFDRRVKDYHMFFNFVLSCIGIIAIGSAMWLPFPSMPLFASLASLVFTQLLRHLTINELDNYLEIVRSIQAEDGPDITFSLFHCDNSTKVGTLGENQK